MEVTSENKCWMLSQRVVWKDLEIKLDLILKSFWRPSIKDEKSWKRCPLSWKILKIDHKRRPPPLWDTTLKRKQRLYHKCNQKCRNVTYMINVGLYVVLWCLKLQDKMTCHLLFKDITFYLPIYPAGSTYQSISSCIQEFWS